jgi:prepilin-type N-terminal cleavage/methylation domain-containing protein
LTVECIDRAPAPRLLLSALCSLLSARAAFTLVELLVAMTIFLVLAAVVITGFRQDDGQRLGASARTLQAVIEGARSKAIVENRRIGVRFFVSPSDPRVVTSVAYVGATQYDQGVVGIAYDDTTGLWYVQNSVDGKWPRLNVGGRNLVQVGSRIEIPRGTGKWYSIAATPASAPALFAALPDPPNSLILAGHYYPSTADPAAGYVAVPPVQDYRLELAPALLPNKEPIPFERNIVLDLDASRIPTLWRPATPAGPYIATMEILFDPRGNVTGDVIAEGLVNFYLTTASDVELTRSNFTDHPANGTGTPLAWPVVPARVDPITRAPIVPTLEPVVISLFTQTGQLTVAPPNLADIPPPGDGLADDPFSYARGGMEAK